MTKQLGDRGLFILRIDFVPNSSSNPYGVLEVKNILLLIFEELFRGHQSPFWVIDHKLQPVAALEISNRLKEHRIHPYCQAWNTITGIVCVCLTCLCVDAVILVIRKVY